jgi:hypothetical protein
MEPANQLSIFFEAISKDGRIRTRHISLYMAMIRYWMGNGFQNPVPVSRSRLMKASKIASPTIYHKCIRELKEYGYIKYEPSYHPLEGSRVYLLGVLDQ